jgi:glycosyltransferase involved in cell wall biosynthesis
VRVLFVAWRDLAHPKAGGSEVVVDVLVRGLQERGNEVTLLCGGPTEPRPYRVVDNGGTYSQYVMAPLRYWRGFRNVDVVVDVVNGMPFFSPLWRRAPRLALVTHLHTDQWGQYFPRPIAAVARTVEQRGLDIAYRHTRFVTISPSTAGDLEKLGIEPARTHVMWLGAQVEEPREVVARSPDPMFVALGRLAPNKRLDLLLDHWSSVSASTGGRLVIVGDGPERERLAERIRTEPALSGVVLEGRVSELRKATLLREAWLLLHAADHEGWGLVIPEAGLCGTPSLAYDAPGVRDAVQDGVSGVLVKSDDAFVQQWIALAGDADRRASLGAHAAERAAAFTWDRSLDDFLVAAEAAIDENRHTRARLPRRGVRPTAGKTSR